MRDRITALGNQLVQVHLALRDQLDRLREGLPVDDLRVYCVAFCDALTRHHTAEDRDVFPVLGAHHPELAPVLAELTRDHHIITEALARLVVPPDDPERLRSEVDTVAALLETHFTYEERKIAALLDRLPATPEEVARIVTFIP
ncbi:hemerythrin domain-containing protein [Actinosynnema sp. NPDC020468]|uniref:hemerythrin domain-containing protein n=1 Tax=Actinosynnema sp. NPDC020468 TaxID=3154488 RepID=UPI0033F19A7F